MKHAMPMEENPRWKRLQGFLSTLPEDVLNFLLQQERWTYERSEVSFTNVKPRRCLVRHLVASGWKGPEVLSMSHLLAKLTGPGEDSAMYDYDYLCETYAMKRIVPAIKAFIRRLK